MKQFEAPIVFDLKPNKKVDKAEFPESKQEYFIDMNIRQQVYDFLDQYFKIFDSDDRELLLDAYAEAACFSISYFQPKIDNGQDLR